MLIWVKFEEDSYNYCCPLGDGTTSKKKQIPSQLANDRMDNLKKEIPTCETDKTGYFYSEDYINLMFPDGRYFFLSLFLWILII